MNSLIQITLFTSRNSRAHCRFTGENLLISYHRPGSMIHASVVNGVGVSTEMMTTLQWRGKRRRRSGRESAGFHEEEKEKAVVIMKEDKISPEMEKPMTDIKKEYLFQLLMQIKLQYKIKNLMQNILAYSFKNLRK